MKNLLTSIKKILGIKNKPLPSYNLNKQAEEPMPAATSVQEAVESIPDDLIKDLNAYKSVKAHEAKLNQDQQLELMEFIARFASTDEINAYFIDRYRLSVTSSLIHQYRRTKKWQPIINKLREKYLLSPNEVAMSHKRVRLDRREKIYQKALKKEDLKTALNAVQGSKEEMEEKGIPVNISFNQYNSLSDEELEDKKRELLERVKNLGALPIKPAAQPESEESTDGIRGIEI